MDMERSDEADRNPSGAGHDDAVMLTVTLLLDETRACRTPGVPARAHVSSQTVTARPSRTARRAADMRGQGDLDAHHLRRPHHFNLARHSVAAALARPPHI